MKKVILTLVIVLTVLLLFAVDYPLVYVHGNNADATYTSGWPTWEDNSMTAYNVIDSVHYKGYTKYNDNCNKYTQLPALSEKTMFNFSYYLGNNEPGVISVSDETALVGFKIVFDEVTNKEIEVAFPIFLYQNEQEFYAQQFDFIKSLPRYLFGLESYTYYQNGRTINGYRISDKTQSYINSWNNNRYGEQLNIFIDKVLAATGAEKVNLVCHSMGGIVARSTCIGYNKADKVNKVITLGTPHKPIESVAGELFFLLFLAKYDWQRNGEIAEMGADADLTIGESVKFMDLEEGDLKSFADHLGYDISPSLLVCISGNRKVLYSKPYDEENDGFIFNSISALPDDALYNPVIYASHSLSNKFYSFDNSKFPELGLCTSTYTTEYIKAWMIDNRIDSIPDNVSETDLNVKFDAVLPSETNSNGSKSLRAMIVDEGGKLNEGYGEILSITTSFYDINGNVAFGSLPIESLGIGFVNAYENNRSIYQKQGAPIVLMELPNDIPQILISKTKIHDMVHGEFAEVTNSNSMLHYAVNYPAGYVNVSTPYSQHTAFSNAEINISTNELLVANDLYYFNFNELTENKINNAYTYNWSQYTWPVPPMRSTPGETYISIKVKSQLDDYGHMLESSYSTTVAWKKIITPAWNPENIQLRSSSESEITFEWTVPYPAESIRVYRDGVVIASLANNATTYSDALFERGVDNHYEVRAKYGDLVSEGIDSECKITVYGIPANMSKPYPLANFNNSKTNLNVKWIDDSDIETGYLLTILTGEGNTISYNFPSGDDTISHLVSFLDDAIYGTINIQAIGPNSTISTEKLIYKYLNCDGLPFYSSQPFAISDKTGNLSYKNSNYLLASSRKYSTDDTVFSIEEYNGTRKDVIFSEFCSGERDAVALQSQDVVMFTDNNSEDFLKVMFKDEFGKWNLTSVTGIFDFLPGSALVKLHSLVEKNGAYYLFISKEYFSSTQGTPTGLPTDVTNSLNIVRIDRTGDIFTKTLIKTIYNNTELNRMYFEGTLKILTDGRIGLTYNSHQQNSTLYSGLGVAILKEDLTNIQYILNPPFSPNTSNHETADLDIFTNKVNLLVNKDASTSCVVELKTYQYIEGNWRGVATNNFENTGNSLYKTSNPRVVYSNNSLFLSWIYNNTSTNQGIVRYKTISSSGTLSTTRNALSSDISITDCAIQNIDGLIKMILQYYDASLMDGTYMLSEISPAYNEIALNLSNSFYGYSDETINLTAKDNFTGEAIANAAVTLTNNKDFTFTGVTDASGSISIPYYTESDNSMVITVEKEYYQKKVYKAVVTINNMNVSLPSDMPVLTTKALNFKVTVSDATLPDATQIPIAGATITLQSTDVSFTGITNLSGAVSCTKKTSYTTPISVTITKDRFRTYETEIYPYMWSTTNEALGANNQTHMVRKPATSYLSIIYSDGDSIVYGSSSDFGNIWYLQKIGAGTMPTMVRRTNGITALWKNGQMLEYATMSSPWTPVDTVINPVYSISEPNLFKHPDPTNDSIFACIIEGTELQTWGDFVLASWYDVLIESMTSQVIVPYTGDEDDNSIIPFSQPIVSKYLALGNYYNLISFISSNNQMVTKLQSPKQSFYLAPFIVSNQEQIVSNSAVDVYGNTSTFIWAADNLSSSEIWKRTLVDGSFTDAERVDSLTGFNSNPKVKDNFLNGYVNDAKKIITTPGTSNSTAYSIVAQSEDSLFNFDLAVKKTLIDANACFVWTEGKNGIYKIKTTQVYYGTIAQPKVISNPTETIIEYIPSSPIYNYVSGRPFVERMTYDAIAMDSVLNYDVKLVVSQTNPVRPQVLMFDTTVIDVIYGTPNTVDTLQYTIPAELYTDGNVKITLDRLRGNPNRVAQIAIYEYETDTTEGTTAGNEKMVKLITKPQMPNMKYDYYLIPTFEYGNNIIRFSVAEQGEVTLSLFDVSGRCIDKIASGVFNPGVHAINLPKGLSSGVYFVKMEAGGQTLIEKMVRIK
ncbi:MAG: T9SS type A sorting domain-containing protein [bacterium]|nr:T9SS type A sorting domain-containing protein [bacterium]